MSTTSGCCQRCGRQYNNFVRDAADWNVMYELGFEKGLVCPNCQTAEESLGAQIDEDEMRNARVVDFLTLPDSDKERIFDQTIHQGVANYVRDVRTRGTMAGDTHVQYDEEKWLDEIVASMDLFKGQNEKVQYHVREATRGHLRGMLGLDD